MLELFRPTSQLIIALTSDCNNNCRICLNKTTRSRNSQNKKISIHKIKELIDEASELHMVGTFWTGGEPLADYTNLLELIKYSSTRGLLSTMVTNGGLIGAFGNYKKLNEEILQKAGLDKMESSDIVRSLVEAGLVRVFLSIDNCHTTLEGADSNVCGSVPSAVAAKALRSFLDAGLGRIHELEAIGYQLRVTATSSGIWRSLTKQILEDVMKRVEVSFEGMLSSNIEIYSNEKGKVLLKHLGIATVGDAATLSDEILEDIRGEKLFQIACSNYTPREHAYDQGKHHGDLFVDVDGFVYPCNDHCLTIGNIYKESLSSIIKGVNSARLEGEYGMTRKIFYSLLTLSNDPNIGNNAMGQAFRLIHSENPELLKDVKTRCGGCSSLGLRRDLQEAFLNAFERTYVPQIHRRYEVQHESSLPILSRDHGPHADHVVPPI